MPRLPGRPLLTARSSSMPSTNMYLHPVPISRRTTHPTVRCPIFLPWLAGEQAIRSSSVTSRPGNGTGYLAPDSTICWTIEVEILCPVTVEDGFPHQGISRWTLSARRRISRRQITLAGRRISARTVLSGSDLSAADVFTPVPAYRARLFFVCVINNCRLSRSNSGRP